ncbi:MAG: lipopolysaccharide biosynthesis protein [Acidobacteriia bacterium]|nr:lipopolysaccharide biosynthesis protein [Terriglobia bacterium]
MGQRLASVALLPITTRFLTPADYGMADLLEQVGVILAIVLGLQFSSSLGYFYFRSEAREARRAVASTGIIGAGCLGVLVALLCWPFAPLISRLVFGSAIGAPYLRLVFATMPASFFLEALLSWVRVEDRPGMYVIGTMVRIGVTIVGTVLLVGIYRLHVWGVLATSLAAMLVTGAFMGVYWLRSSRPAFDARLFVAMARFAAPVGLSGVAVFLIHFGDRFFLPHYRPLAELGIYVLAYKLGMLLAVIYAAFQIYWSAQVYQIMQRHDADEVFARLFTYVILGLSFFGLGIVVCAQPTLKILAAPAYQGAAALVPVIVAAYYTRAVGDFVRCLFLAAGRPGYDAACNWLGALFCLTGYILLIPKYGIWGAAFATVAAFTVIGVVSVVWTYRLRPYRIESGRMAKIGLSLAAALPVYLLPRAASLPAQIGLAALSVSVFLVALWVLRFPTRGELVAGRTAIQSAFRRLGMVSSAGVPAGD